MCTQTRKLQRVGLQIDNSNIFRNESGFMDTQLEYCQLKIQLRVGVCVVPQVVPLTLTQGLNVGA